MPYRAALLGVFAALVLVAGCGARVSLGDTEDFGGDGGVPASEFDAADEASDASVIDEPSGDEDAEVDGGLPTDDASIDDASID